MTALDETRASRVRGRFEFWLRTRRVTVQLDWDDDKQEYKDLDEQWLWLAYFEGAYPVIGRQVPSILQSISKPIEVKP